MSDTGLPTYAEADGETTDEPTTPKGLRANRDAANARIKELESQVETVVDRLQGTLDGSGVDAIGLDPAKTFQPSLTRDGRRWRNRMSRQEQRSWIVCRSRTYFAT